MDGYRRTDSRAPLAYLLLGQIIGLSSSSVVELPPLILLLSALPFALLAIDLASKSARTIQWSLAFLLAASLTFCGYGKLRQPPEPTAAAAQLPAREATLTIQIRHLYSGNPLYNSTQGLAEVTDAPQTSHLKPGALVYFQTSASTFPIITGQSIRARGVLSPIQIARPITTDDDFDLYLKDNHVHYRFARLEALESIHPGPRYQHWLAAANRRFERILYQGAVDGQHFHSIYTAMLLGKKEVLSEAATERYQHSGTMHFFAISGLHIGVIASVIAQCLFLLRVPRKWSPCIGLPLLFLYALITGAEPSAMRAFLMTAFFWAAYGLQRQRAPIPALIASAVCVLLIAPEQIRSIGFQLSYAVVLSILLLGLPLYSYLAQRWHPYRFIPRDSLSNLQKICVFAIDKFCLLFAISLSAWIASAPISAAVFGFVAPLAILLNILLVHIVALIICTGVISLSFGLIGLTWISGWLNHSAWLLIDLSNHIIEHSLRLPYSTVSTEGFPLLVCYGLMSLQIATLFWLHRHRPNRIELHPQT